MDEPSHENVRKSDYFTKSTVKVIAGCFALAAFGVAVVAGLSSDNSTERILSRALICMTLCYPIGWIIGLICQRIIEEHIHVHEQANPAPDSMAEFPVMSKDVPEESDEEIITV